MLKLGKIYDSLIKDFSRLHINHQNRAHAIQILETLKRKGVLVYAGTKTLEAIRSIDTYPIIEEEIHQT